MGMNDTPNNWLNTYDNDGFVIVPDLIDKTTLLKLRQGIENITDNVDTLSPELREKIFLEREHVLNNSKWYEGSLSAEDCGNSVRQIADLPLFDQMFVELIRYPPMLDVLEVL